MIVIIVTFITLSILLDSCLLYDDAGRELW